MLSRVIGFSCGGRDGIRGEKEHFSWKIMDLWVEERQSGVENG